MTWNELKDAAFEDVVQDQNFIDLRDYLRAEEDDDRTVFLCALAAMEYIISAVGAFDEDDQTAVLVFKAITQEFYDNRILKDSRASLTQPFQRISYVNESMLLQLKLKHDLKQEAAG